MGALEFLIQNAEPSGITLVDARYGFNKLSRLNAADCAALLAGRVKVHVQLL